MSQVKLSSRTPLASVIILVAFMLALAVCAGMLRGILRDNTNVMGLSLVKNYSSVEEENIETCRALLNICSDYIAESEQMGIPAAQLRERLCPLMDGLANEYGNENVRIYGVLSDGKAVVSNLPESGALTEYDVTGTQWYQGAAAANGEIYLSPVYTQPETGLPVVTMCRLIPQTGSVLAIDLRLSYFEMNCQGISVPEGSSYFLVDPEGNLLNYLSSWDGEREEFQKLVDSYRENTACEQTDHMSEDVKGADGIIRNVFFHHMENGWTGILTIPRDEIFSGTRSFHNIVLLMIGFSLALIAFLFIREYKNRKREKEYQVYQKAMNSTVRAVQSTTSISIP